MWYRAPYCRKSALLIALIFSSLWVVRAGYGNQQMTDQHPPINKIRLIEALEKVTIPQSTLIEEILDYGVDFDLNSEVEAELKKVKAGEALIQAVRDSKLCNSVDRIIIAVKVLEYEKNAYEVYAALKKIRCPVTEPKEPDIPPKIYKDSKPIELRYFEKLDSELAKNMADYIKRSAKVEIIPVPVKKPLREANMPKTGKSELEIYFLFNKETR